MDVKFRAPLGAGNKDDKSVRILNRVLSVEGEGIMYEADRRHGEIICRDANLEEGSKAVKTPGNKEMTGEGIKGFSETAYRSIAARANYLAQDRMDIQFAVK